MNPETLTLISGIILLLLFVFVGWRVRATSPSRRRHAGTRAGDQAGGCCEPPRPTDQEKHERAAN